MFDARGTRTVADADMMKLYSKRILALSADMPFTKRLEAPTATARKRSPLCGSTVTVDVTLTDGKISDYGQDVKACALGQAAASVVGRNAIGRTIDEISKARQELQAMLTQDGPPPSPPFEDLEVLSPAKDFKNRHASILLTLDAILAAFEDNAQSAVS